MIARLWALLGLLLIPACLLAAGSEQTINTLPAANSGFQTNLANFLKREDAKRYQQQFESFVVSGGTHATAASLTATPASMIAYPGGYYVTEIGSITYLDNETTWVIAHKDLTGSLGNFARVPGTHYLIDSVSGSKPTLPADSAWLMVVTTAGGSITAVTDLRTRVPYAGTFLFAELPASSLRGRLAFVSDKGPAGIIYYDTGFGWVSLLANPMTTQGDMIGASSGGFPIRIAKGSANQILGMNNGASAQEYKTVTAGSGITVSHSANAVTIAQAGTSPAGALQMYMGTTAPSGWLLCDAAAYDGDTYPDLFDVAVTNASVWGRGPPIGTFTVNTGTDTATLTAHGQANGSRVHVANSGGGLPSGLSADTKYFIINATTDTFQFSLTVGGAVIDITTAGTGTQSLYDKFQVPDLRARTPVGISANSHDFTISAVDTGTEQITLESNTALYTGDSTFYDTSAGAIGGLTDATTYYVIRVSATVVKLATTEANALAGTAINLTSAGSGTQVLRQTYTTRTIGTYGGTENVAGGTHSHALTDPGHVHDIAANGGSGSTHSAVTLSTIQDQSTSGVVKSGTTGLTVTNTSALGGGANLSPFLAVNFIVKT